MPKKPHILITNDDGILAQGIKTLFDAIHPFAKVSIVAPMVDKSGKALSLTLRKPLHAEQFPWPKKGVDAWSISGTPADCVKMALSVLLDSPPDLLISGVNRGSNAGRNILYSGTIGATIEASFHGVPAIAFSCEDYAQPDYDMAAKHIPTLAKFFLSQKLPQDTIWNITFPQSVKEAKGYRLAHQGKGYWMEDIAKRTHPLGTPYYWLSGKIAKFDEAPQSDIALLKEGYITLVPAQVNDLTNYSLLEKLEGSLPEIPLQKAFSET